MTAAMRAASVLLLATGVAFGLGASGVARAAEPDYRLIDAMAEPRRICVNRRPKRNTGPGFRVACWRHWRSG